MSRTLSIGLLCRGLIVLFVSLLAFGYEPVIAGDPPLLVDTTADDPTKNSCQDALPDDCSLRAAITAANVGSDLTTINLETGQTYVLDETSTNEDLNVNGDLDIIGSLIINGNGATINANAIDRVLDIFPPPPLITDPFVTLTDLTIAEGLGQSLETGGGLNIHNGIAVTLDNVTLTNNVSADAGGGIFVEGDADFTMVSSTVSQNTSSFSSGGGLAKNDGTGSWLVEDSEFLNNTAAGGGGGALFGLSDSAELVNTDFIGNDGINGAGGGAWVGADVISITGGTFDNNESLHQGGGLAAFAGVNLSGTAFTQNTSGSSGGGAWVGQEGAVENAVITGNTASAGGGIQTIGADVSFSTIAGNTAIELGGGVFAEGDAEINHSAITNNQSNDTGGGIELGRGAPSVTNSTISGNNAAVDGGGIARFPVTPDIAGEALPQGGPPDGPARLSFLTITDNTALNGANLYKPNAAVALELLASIVSDPVTGANCFGDITSLGFNIEDTDTCSLDDLSDLPNTDPLLQPLANNGGPTQTHALQQGSPAVDFVDSGCPPPNDDQRGNARPLGTACDAGAFESTFSATPSPTPDATPTPSPTSSPAPTGSPTATPTSTPTGGGQQVIWGDHNCSGSADPVDGLLNLRHDAGLPTETNECPEMGDNVNIQGDGTYPWGDLDCSGAPDPVDGLKVLRFDAGLDVARPNDCPDPGADVIVA